METEETMRESTDLILRQQVEQNPMMAQFEDIMREFMTKHLDWQELRPEFVQLYVDIYTEPELREMTAFYRTPLGRKMLETLPQVTVRSQEISQRRLQQHLPEMMQQIMQRMGQQQDPVSRP